mgnify:CR=1 FL=1|jgi:membrane protein
MEKYRKFFLVDIWSYSRNDLSRNYYSLLGVLRVIVMAVHGFRESKCRLWASALTYFSVFALVPVTAMAFGIAKGFGLDETLKQSLYEKFYDYQQILDYVFEYAGNLLETTRGGMIAGIGVVMLFWAVIKMLGNIEAAFNTIWGVKTHRTLFRKFSDYLSMALICPILILAASSMTTFVQGYLSHVSTAMLPEMLSGPLVSFMARSLPFMILWVLFPFLYSFMPNTKVRWSAAIPAGILAGTAFQFLQQGYLALQIYLTSYNTIYGSFSALPLFLIWLQLSWLLVLFGAEISCAIQTSGDREFEPLVQELSPKARTRVMLAVAAALGQSFKEDNIGLTDEKIAELTGIPARLVRDGLYRLEDAGVVVRTQEKELFYPAVPMEKFTALGILRMVSTHGKDYRPQISNRAFDAADASLTAMEENVRKSELDAPFPKVEQA